MGNSLTLIMSKNTKGGNCVTSRVEETPRAGDGDQDCATARVIVMQLPIPSTERERLAALRSYNILDTTPDPDFDSLVKLASFICRTPVALLSLVDEDRQWFKAKVGIEASETPRHISFCTHAIAASGMMVIPDAEEDERFRGSPLVVGEPRIRFYAGMPLVTSEGHKLGTLCVIDHEPRTLKPEQLEALEILAHQAVALLELRRGRDNLARTFQALRSLEDKFSKIFHSSPAAITISSLDEGRYIDVNDAFLHTTGYSREEIIGRNTLEVGFWADPARRVEIVKLLEQHGNVRDQEIQFRTKDGKVRTGLLSAEHFALGSVPCLLAVTKDISEWKQAQEELRKSQAHLARAQQIARLGSWESDLATGALVWSDEVFRIFDVNRETFDGTDRSFFERVHPDDREKIREAVRNAVKGKLPYKIEHRIVRLDGAVRYVSEEGEVVFDPAGRAVRIVGTAQDVTERRAAEQALAERENLLRTIIEAEPDCVKLLDRDGALLQMNSAGLAMMEVDSFEQAKGKRVVSFVIPEDREKFKQLTENVFQGQSGQLQFEIVGMKGAHRSLETSAVPLRDENGNVTALLGITRDVTEHLQMEKQLLQAQKMEAVGRLAGGIAHDFNNLLNIILGYGQLLSERVEKDETARGYAEEITRAGNRAAGLTRQLLAFSRQQVIARQVIDLNQLLANLTKMLRRLIGEDIELVLTTRADVGRINADPGQIEQVIMNLAVNARDAMPKGGKLTIETANVVLDESYARTHAPVRPGRYVMVAVSDTGVGMDPEIKGHIFEPFFTTKEIGKGTGLGLATVYGIVKQSEGYIWAYSERGQGATFKIYLPWEREAESRDAETDVKSVPARGSETILVVEDESALRRLVCEVLRGAGYTVLEAAQGEDAVRLASDFKDPIALLLTDVVMPGMGGRELAEQLAPIHSETKVIYMSGYTDDAIVRHGVLEAGTAFLQKPFSPAGVTRKVREILDRH
jgi:PAS domain S-box-containing protein